MLVGLQSKGGWKLLIVKAERKVRKEKKERDKRRRKEAERNERMREGGACEMEWIY